MVRLNGNGFCLREWRLTDAAAMVKYANNPKIAMYLSDRFPYPYTDADSQTWVNYHTSKNTVDNLAIDVNGEVVGGIGIEFKQDIFRRTAVMGYWLGEPFWGKGIMTEVVKLMADYTFKNFDIVRLQAGTFDCNPASMRVLEKAGFVKEGISKYALTKQGVTYDEHVFALYAHGKLA